MKKPAFLMILACSILFIDIFSKYWVQSYLPLISSAPNIYPYGGIGIFHNFLGINFSINHAINTGAAWGIFSNFQYFLVILRIIIVSFLTWHVFYRCHWRNLHTPFTLILSGAMGNIIDYFLYHHVIDMFAFSFWGYDYPIFNIADSSICVGTLWIAIRLIDKK